MPTSTVRTLDRVGGALGRFLDADIVDAANVLLRELGYESERTFELSGEFDELIKSLNSEFTVTQAEDALRENVKSIRIIHQITDEEIESSASLQGILMDETSSFDAGTERSFIFVAVELQCNDYPRGKYADFTREINKHFKSPAIVIFKTSSNHVTLAFVDRREHKRNKERAVLGSVSLIRNIEPSTPHRAHIEILTELSLANMLGWMDQNDQPANFDGLLKAWLAKLDTQELNKQFYNELFSWFERAVKVSTFPTNQAKTIPPQEHVVRLITRLMFVWFIKEKHLIADQLFNETQVGRLLKNYNRDSGDSYYRAILQNLFFGTLNTEIKDRRFNSKSRKDHRNFSVYRYRDEIADERSLMALLEKTPFINGGLFDCLDDFLATRSGGYRIDCFSDHKTHRNLLSIPNRLFFDDDGIITLFEKYKFTVEENTPAEQEVALDPELLGSVFENLLAAYNPETRESARKMTGSYYTPRPVVDYMVDEALVASLIRKCMPTDGDARWWEDRLHYLLDYNDAGELFEDAEAERVVRAIAELRVLDPAVGSGAFPMGILHKLTLALSRLDPKNKWWARFQKELALHRADEAFEEIDQHQRDERLQEISDTFQRYRESDFGRKLYLIQNSIFGVDIQPIACQIAKLRFFISLAIEQQSNNNPSDNFGIKPLPNLETRFVASNALFKLEEGFQIPLGNQNKVADLNRQLRFNREQHFHADVRSEKLQLRQEDARLRVELANELVKAGMSEPDAEKLSRWDPFDQNTNADWFNSGYMFSVYNGFDVVIGNPPYIQLQKDGGKLGRLYKDAEFTTFASTGDIYQLFYERGCKLLSRYGVLSYITSNSWLKSEYGKSTRRYFSGQHTPLRLIEMGKDIFENAIVDTSILILRSGKGGEIAKAVDMDRLPSNDFPPDEEHWDLFRPRGERPWSILSTPENGVLDKMQMIGIALKEWDVNIYRGVTTGYNRAFVVDDATRLALIAADPKSSEVIKPLLRGRDIQRYKAKWAKTWLIDIHNGYGTCPAVSINDYLAIKAHLDQFYPQLEKRYDQGKTPYNLRSCAFYEEFSKEKLFWMDLTERGRFAFDDQATFCVNTIFMITGVAIKYLCSILNSNLITWYMKNTALNSGMGVTRWVGFTVERIPIPQISAAKQRPFIRLVDRILKAKDGDPDADTSDLEAEIDQLVYQLYDLTDEEIAAVESHF